MRKPNYCSFTLPLLLAASPVFSHEVEEERIVELSPFAVEGRARSLIGETISSSQGVIGQVDLEMRPLLRTGEILETIPGLIATQHSGTGKANQYFLRGFNLDHGTDFSVHVDGMPVNMPTHGHGQGYLDMNFVIPEMVETLEFRKGSYYADVGDFSSAGSARLRTFRRLSSDFVQVELGEDSFARLTAGQTIEIDRDSLLTYGVEANYYDGPWEIGENLAKFNALASYTHQNERSIYTLTFMGYDAEWDSADQIPQRAVEQGIISELGSLDDDVGGDSSRYSLSGHGTLFGADSRTDLTVYAIKYDLSLWSNFTYFLDDPVNGDEFKQLDDRWIFGGELTHKIFSHVNGNDMVHRFGIQSRYDWIDDVGLFKTADREILSTVRRDSVDELSVGLFYENTYHWTQKLRTVAALRWDGFLFDVDSNIPENSGSEDDYQFSPKLTVIYEATERIELFAAAGIGFHSNDARGTTISVDPTDPSVAVDPVDPLVETRGAETGIRFQWDDKLNSSLTVWWLELDSELLFVGDAGITEPSRPSQRYGIEWTNYYRPFEWLVLDFDVSFSEADFDDDDPAGDKIPGAIDTVVQAGATWISDFGFFSTLRMRFFDGRPLIEDGSIESDSSTVFNLRLGYNYGENWSFHLDILNLFDSGDDDITYYYASRLPGEPAAGIEDIHYHIMEPRTIRAAVKYTF